MSKQIQKNPCISIYLSSRWVLEPQNLRAQVTKSLHLFVLFYEPVPEDFYLPPLEGEIGLPGIAAVVVGVGVP
jgi:hypothetical protein